MMQIKSILVMLERAGDPAQILTRAAMLARRFDARLEIFMCEAEGAYALEHQYDATGSNDVRRSCLAKMHTWMDHLWRSLNINDVRVSVEAAYENPWFEAIIRKVKRSKADLVLRGIGVEDQSTFNVCDLDLLRACPVPLLLTRGKPWKTPASIAAALDVSGDESPEITRAVLQSADFFARRCRASLESLFASRFEEGPPDAAVSHRACIARHAADAGVSVGLAHVLTGDPITVIPKFVTRRGYEMLVLGALTHHEALTAQVGTLTGRLIETLACDLLLVRSPEAIARSATLHRAEPVRLYP